MINRNPHKPVALAPTDSAPTTFGVDMAQGTNVASALVLTSPIERPQDTLAGTLPAWDLLPPNAFVKRASRRSKGETSTL